MLERFPHCRILRIGPHGLDTLESRREALCVRVSRLREDSRDPFGVLGRQHESHDPEVEYVHDVLGQTDLFGEFVDGAGDIDEVIRVVLWIGATRVAEAWIIWRYDVEGGGEQWNDISKGMRGRGMAVEEEEAWEGGRACFSIEDLDRVDLRGLVLNGRHGP